MLPVQPVPCQTIPTYSSVELTSNMTYPKNFASQSLSHKILQDFSGSPLPHLTTMLFEFGKDSINVIYNMDNIATMSNDCVLRHSQVFLTFDPIKFPLKELWNSNMIHSNVIFIRKTMHRNFYSHSGLRTRACNTISGQINDVKYNEMIMPCDVITSYQKKSILSFIDSLQ